MAPMMKAKTIEALAKEGGWPEVRALLLAYGDQPTEDDPKRSCLDCIVAGILSDVDNGNTNRRNEVNSFLAKTGVYANLSKAVPQDVVKEFRETIAELTKQVAELKEAVVQLGSPSKIMLKKE